MNRRQHMATDRLLLGYTHEGVHAMIDEAVKWLGAGHRSVRHTHQQVKFFEAFGGEEQARIALLHILIDNRVLDRDWLEKNV